MNLWFRTIWMFLTSSLATASDIRDGVKLWYRVWPADCDFNLHMTNARYHSFNDLARIAMVVRAGVFRKIVIENKWAPTLAGTSIRFLKSLKPFERFSVTSKVVSWDEKWLYIEHRIERADGKLAAYTVCKTCFVGPDGRVPIDELNAAFNYTGDKLFPPEKFQLLFEVDPNEEPLSQAA